MDLILFLADFMDWILFQADFMDWILFLADFMDLILFLADFKDCILFQADFMDLILFQADLIDLIIFITDFMNLKICVACCTMVGVYIITMKTTFNIQVLISNKPFACRKEKFKPKVVFIVLTYRTSVLWIIVLSLQFPPR